MIVGFHSITNAHIVQESHRGTAADVGDTLDPSVGGNRQTLDETQSQFQVLGAQICGLQFRKIRHAWLSSKRVDKSRLSQPWWSSVERWRDEEEGEDDLIEVELAELEDLDEGWVREASGDSIFLVRQSDEL
ncbi:hypothetical protein V8F33_012958 [Rhypophila sp. PSN 637]